MNKKLIIAISCLDSRVSGYIMRSALEYANEKGDYDYLVVTPGKSDKPNHISISMSLLSRPMVLIDKVIDILNGNERIDGFSHIILTKKMISILKEYEKKYEKVIFHIHSFHSVPYSMPELIKHIKKNDFPCVYTVYDSWAYCGGCYNHEQHNCEEYKNGCVECQFGYIAVQQRFRRNKKRNLTHEKYLQKINIDLSTNRLILVPVSDYCRDRLQETPLKRYDMTVIKPETTIRPMDTNRDIKKELGIPATNKIVVSACAFWCELKGVTYLYEIAKRLPDDYTLLVIGGDFDKKGYNNIVYVPFCDNITELPLYLQIADVFVSVTQGDTFNVTIVEAQVCGVPIVGFGHGGTPETITERSGIMVGTDNNTEKLVENIIKVVDNKPFDREDIIASGMRFARGDFKEKYFEIYNKIGN